MNLRDPESPLRRMSIAVASAVVIMTAAGLLYLFEMPDSGGAKVNGPAIVAAARAYTRDLRLRQQPVPKSITLEELVARHFLQPGDAAAFRGLEAALQISTDQPGPKAVLMRVRMPDGAQVVLLADGTVREAAR